MASRMWAGRMAWLANISRDVSVPLFFLFFFLLDDPETPTGAGVVGVDNADPRLLRDGVVGLVSGDVGLCGVLGVAIGVVVAPGAPPTNGPAVADDIS